jgi:hypothetical protein
MRLAWRLGQRVDAISPGDFEPAIGLEHDVGVVLHLAHEIGHDDGTVERGGPGRMTPDWHTVERDGPAVVAFKDEVAG